MLTGSTLPTRMPARPSGVLTLNRFYHSERSALETIRQMWAESTWTSRGHLWSRYQAFCSAHQLDPLLDLDWAAVVFVESTRTSTSAATRHQYSKDLSAIATRLSLQTPVARMYQAGLRATGALIPERQAPPITIEQLRQLAPAALRVRLGLRLYALLFLAWKTGSRYHETHLLQRKQIIHMSPQRIIVNWSDRTKASRSSPYRPDMLTIVEHPPRIPQQVLTALAELTDDEMTLFPHPVEWFDRWIKEQLPGSGLSAHSLKAGTAAFLTRMVVEKELRPELLPRLLKHKTDGATDAGAWSATTLTYTSRDLVALAEALGTQEATRLLPW